LLLHLRHHFRRAKVDFLARRRAAGNEIGGHEIFAAYGRNSSKDPDGF
jgi:hypothetical protein